MVLPPLTDPQEQERTQLERGLRPIPRSLLDAQGRIQTRITENSRLLEDASTQFNDRLDSGPTIPGAPVRDTSEPTQIMRSLGLAGAYTSPLYGVPNVTSLSYADDFEVIHQQAEAVQSQADEITRLTEQIYWDSYLSGIISALPTAIIANPEISAEEYAELTLNEEVPPNILATIRYMIDSIHEDNERRNQEALETVEKLKEPTLSLSTFHSHHPEELTSQDLVDLIVGAGRFQNKPTETPEELRYTLLSLDYSQEELDSDFFDLQAKALRDAEALRKHNAQMHLLREEGKRIGNGEIVSDWKKIQWAQAVSQPAIYAMRPVEWWTNQVVRPLGFYGVRAMYEVEKRRVNAIDAILGPYGFQHRKASPTRIPINPGVVLSGRYFRSDAVQLDALFQKARADGFNDWQAASIAVEEWDTNGFVKFSLEIAADPLSYVGFGVGKVVSKAFPKIGRPISAFEMAYNDAMEYPFDKLKYLWVGDVSGATRPSREAELFTPSVRQGLFRDAEGQFRGGSWALQSLRQRSERVSKDVFRQFREVYEASYNGKPIGLSTPEEIKEVGRDAIRKAFDNSRGMDEVTELGIGLVGHTPVSIASARTLMGSLRNVPQDIGLNFADKRLTSFMELLNRVLEDTDGLGYGTTKFINIDEATREVASLFAVSGEQNMTLIKGWLQNQRRANMRRAMNVFEGDSARKIINNIHNHVSDSYIRTMQDQVQIKRYQMGNVARVFDKVRHETKLTWLHTVDRVITQPLARSYLVFGFYPVGNILEAGVKMALAGTNPFKVGNVFWDNTQRFFDISGDVPLVAVMPGQRFELQQGGVSLSGGGIAHTTDNLGSNLDGVPPDISNGVRGILTDWTRYSRPANMMYQFTEAWNSGRGMQWLGNEALEITQYNAGGRLVNAMYASYIGQEYDKALRKLEPTAWHTAYRHAEKVADEVDLDGMVQRKELDKKIAESMKEAIARGMLTTNPDFVSNIPNLASLKRIPVGEAEKIIMNYPNLPSFFHPVILEAVRAETAFSAAGMNSLKSTLEDLARHHYMSQVGTFKNRFREFVQETVNNPSANKEEMIHRLGTIADGVKIFEGSLGNTMSQAFETAMNYTSSQARSDFMTSVYEREIIPAIREINNGVFDAEQAMRADLNSKISNAANAQEKAELETYSSYLEAMMKQHRSWNNSSERDIQLRAERFLPTGSNYVSPNRRTNSWWQETLNELRANWDAGRRSMLSSTEEVLALEFQINKAKLPIVPDMSQKSNIEVLDLARLLGSNPNDVQQSLYRAELQSLRSRDNFLAEIKSRANLSAKEYGVDAEELGWTDVKINRLYDHMASKVAHDVNNSPEMAPINAQLNGLLQDLRVLGINKGAMVNEDIEKAFQQMARRAAQSLEGGTTQLIDETLRPERARRYIPFQPEFGPQEIGPLDIRPGDDRDIPYDQLEFVNRRTTPIGDFNMETDAPRDILRHMVSNGVVTSDQRTELIDEAIEEIAKDYIEETGAISLLDDIEEGYADYQDVFNEADEEGWIFARSNSGQGDLLEETIRRKVRDLLYSRGIYGTPSPETALTLHSAFTVPNLENRRRLAATIEATKAHRGQSITHGDFYTTVSEDIKAANIYEGTGKNRNIRRLTKVLTDTNKYVVSDYYTLDWIQKVPTIARLIGARDKLSAAIKEYNQAPARGPVRRVVQEQKSKTEKAAIAAERAGTEEQQVNSILTANSMRSRLKSLTDLKPEDRPENYEAVVSNLRSQLDEQGAVYQNLSQAIDSSNESENALVNRTRTVTSTHPRRVRAYNEGLEAALEIQRVVDEARRGENDLLFIDAANEQLNRYDPRISGDNIIMRMPERDPNDGKTLVSRDERKIRVFHGTGNRGFTHLRRPVHPEVPNIREIHGLFMASNEFYSSGYGASTRLLRTDPVYPNADPVETGAWAEGDLEEQMASFDYQLQTSGVSQDRIFDIDLSANRVYTLPGHSAQYPVAELMVLKNRHGFGAIHFENQGIANAATITASGFSDTGSRRPEVSLRELIDIRRKYPELDSPNDKYAVESLITTKAKEIAPRQKREPGPYRELDVRIREIEDDIIAQLDEGYVLLEEITDHLDLSDMNLTIYSSTGEELKYNDLISGNYTSDEIRDAFPELPDDPNRFSSPYHMAMHDTPFNTAERVVRSGLYEIEAAGIYDSYSGKIFGDEYGIMYAEESVYDEFINTDDPFAGALGVEGTVDSGNEEYLVLDDDAYDIRGFLGPEGYTPYDSPEAIYKDIPGYYAPEEEAEVLRTFEADPAPVSLDSDIEIHGMQRLKDREGFNASRSTALQSSNLKRVQVFPDYDNLTNVSNFMRMIFPFWGYEAHRWAWWTPREILKHPGALTAVGKYRDNTDNGYIDIPGPLDFDLTRGGITMGAWKRLAQRDYPEYYDRYPGVSEFLDYGSRWGFYPGAPISFAMSTLGPAAGGPQLGENAPPMVRSLQAAANAILPDNEVMKLINETILPDRFKNYLIANEVSTLTLNRALAGSNVTDILDKYRAGTLTPDEEETFARMSEAISGGDILVKFRDNIPLTPEEEALWSEAQSNIGFWQIFMEQTGMMRLQPDEKKELRKYAQELTEEITGLPAGVQEDMRQGGVRYEDVWGAQSQDLRTVLNSLEVMSHYSNSEGLMPSEIGVARGRMRTFWSTVEKLHDENKAKLDSIEKAVLRDDTAEEPISRWLDERREKVRKGSEIIPTLKASPLYQDVPVTLLERKEFAEESGVKIAFHPLEELRNDYYGIELHERYDVATRQTVDNYDRFYLERAAILSALPEHQQQEFIEFINKNDTPLEQLHYQTWNKFIRPYRAARDVIMNQREEGDQNVIARASVAVGTEREQLLAETDEEGNKIVALFNDELNQSRETIRFTDPVLDAWLLFWREGGISTLKTREAEAYYYEHLDLQNPESTIRRLGPEGLLHNMNSLVANDPANEVIGVDADSQ